MCRFRIAPSRVAVGQLASHYGVACAMCMWGVSACFSFSAPSLANVSAISFPMILVWALTLSMCIRCGVQ